MSTLQVSPETPMADPIVVTTADEFFSRAAGAAPSGDAADAAAPAPPAYTNAAEASQPAAAPAASAAPASPDAGAAGYADLFGEDEPAQPLLRAPDQPASPEVAAPEAASTAAAPAGGDAGTAPELATVAQALGLEALPQTPEEVSRAINALVTERAIALAQGGAPELVSVNNLLALEDGELVAQHVTENRLNYGLATQNRLREFLDDLKDSPDDLTAIASQIRGQLQGRQQELLASAAQQQRQWEAERQQAEAAEAELRQKFQQTFRAGAENLKGPDGRPMRAGMVDRIVNDYVMSGAFYQELEKRFSSDPAFAIEIAMRLHPDYGAGYEAQRLASLRSEGESQVLRTLDGSTPKVGAITPEVPAMRVEVRSSDEFFARAKSA